MPNTHTVSAITSIPDTETAAHDLASKVSTALGGQRPDALIVFASPDHDHERMLATLARDTGTETIVGCSSAGEFTNTVHGCGRISLMALRSSTMKFQIGLGRGVSSAPEGAARQLATGFRGIEASPLPHRAALVMTDALAGHADALVEHLTVATRGNYRFFGGGAGDDAKFSKTYVFAGTRAYTDAVVALEILSSAPVGIGVAHGWVPASRPLRVTEANAMRLISLNGMPAVEAFAMHAAATGQQFDAAEPMPFFLHNILGIESLGEYRLRVPLGVNDDGSLTCAANVPANAVVYIMRTTESSAVAAAERATRAAVESLGGGAPSAALVFDCVATRLRMGTGFDNELRACASLLSPAQFVGCNTYGQIARADGQFGGFHNCTAVVCALPG
jgi:hypothetical protein